MTRKIRVLVIDDSALVRKTITDTLQMDPDIEVVGVANDPLIAMDKIPKLHPDVLTLDMEMPRMDGLTFLRQLKQENSPLPVVVISSLTQQGSKLALDAMEAGAKEVLAKPDGSSSIGALAGKLAFHIKAAARARRDLAPLPTTKIQPSLPSRPRAPAGMDRRLVVIGSSTGGVEALRYILPALPADLPPIAIVQHIPAYFSKAVAERINGLSAMEVREAADNDPLLPGVCLIAPGDYHMMIVKQDQYRVRLVQTPPVHHCRPAVDVLFRSAAAVAGAHTLGVVLTGMGRDGARGLGSIKEAGGCSLAQNEASSVIYGMPRAAVELGVVDRSVHLQAMPQAIVETLNTIKP
ncbi:MAG: two-component system chemotaxis response regulator CheB [Cyanobium sp.]|jgi:two-component system chemotaxis response regulator CheB|uniref:protein-glutamate methylesterase/protein-glutamine glutaminase n=2 Tax=Synechococcales TaxID=1890424 RepID=UPI0019B29C87|nr:chemotaxis response regulator protein-glutamate methylesterase [Synechococcus sp. CS-1331]NQW38514.1 chemotaxis response regulator protein-glutamate methylesterase [Cyanobacteria bacterium bin.275]